ncbi:hypothetical protein [Vineibacter terrae]|uniref:hypothetical protein n=1 Tax=Vineibacter terrae TaxID=2586908 RepID=UPI002E2FA253|nr:hypothetical protein [Vineibacter terrae]HEX2885395.1 hypothetical protein [Vineibacter terrae]
MVAIGRCAGIVLLVLLAACGRLPNTAVPDSMAERHYGAANAATPIATLIKQHDIKPLDPGAGLPLLDQAERALRRTDAAGRHAGVTYSLSKDNALDAGWLVQTPMLWSHSAADLPFYPLDCAGCFPDVSLPTCRSNADCANGGTCRTLASTATRPGEAGRQVCVGHSDALLDRIHGLITQARRTVDIALLQPPPDGRFVAALRNAVTTLGRSGRSVQVRVVVGHYPPAGVEPGPLLTALARNLAGLPSARVTLQVAVLRSCAGESGCDSFSWNHAKIVAVDRRAALVGGHNMWTRDYLLDHPVHDLSMQARGPAAASAARFIDALWQFACDSTGRSNAVSVLGLPAGQAQPTSSCLQMPAPPPSASAGNVPILAVGRLASGITTDFANQSDLARDLLLGAARRSIRIVQQDLAFTLGRADPLYPESTLERLADFLLSDRGDLQIVLSDPTAVGNSGSSYGNGVSLDSVAHKIRQVARARTSMPDPMLDALLCRRLHLAQLRFGPDATWPDKRPIGSHTKFWMVDDHIFYIGSDNFYPVDLQEFGYIVDSPAAAAEILRTFWTPLWRWSRLSAVSGADAPRCALNTTSRQN